MNKPIAIILFLFVSLLLGARELRSPEGGFGLLFKIDNGIANYELRLKEQQEIRPSQLSLELVGTPSLFDGFSAEPYKESSFDSSWNPIRADQSEIRNLPNDMMIHLVQEDSGGKLIPRFRLLEDGLGFRYEFPEQERPTSLFMAEERTRFALTGEKI